MSQTHINSGLTLIGLGAFLALGFPVGGVFAQDTDNLLDPSVAQVEQSFLDSGHATQIPAILDGDPSTSASFSTGPENATSIDLVFSILGDGVAPEKLILTAATGAEHRRPAGFDILYSNVSATNGFRSIRNEAFDPLKPSETFKLPVSGANWIMLRLYPKPDATSLALADIQITGDIGTPETRYEFGESPTNAIEIVEALSDLSDNAFTITEAERAIFDGAKSGPISQADFETVALIASGVREPDARAAFITNLDQIEQQARGALDLSASPRELGQDLLVWLHDVAFTEGYLERQTDLSVVFTDQQFNCVSSAVFYNILGQRLGLDLRAIEVPDHAFSILYDGVDHVDVETTTPNGFNPRRDKIAEFELLTGFEYIPESNKSKRREIGRAGLAALIYYNHGVLHLENGEYLQSLLANFRALSLDPEFSSAATNALAAMGRWSRHLATSENWDQATRVAAVGRALAPEDTGLAQSEVSIWQNYALAVLEAEGSREALSVLTRASTKLPHIDFDPLRAAVFIRPGEADIKAGRWDAAMARADKGLELLDGSARADIDEWRAQVFLRKSRQALTEQRYDEAADILLEARSNYPKNQKVTRAALYLVQTWSDEAADFATGLAILETFAQKFAPLSELDGVVERYVSNHILSAVEASVPVKDALVMAGAATPVLALTGSREELKSRVYRIYGQDLIKREDWSAAADLYSAGLSQFSDDYNLKQNARFVAQEWQRSALSNGGNDELEQVVSRLRNLFPSFAQDNGFGEQELRNQVLRLVKSLDYTGALDALNGAQLLLSGETYRDLRLHIIEHEAGRAIDAKDWQHAASIYSKGRTELGEANAFSNNVVYIAQEWTIEAGKSGGANGVVDTMGILVSLFPDDSSVAEMGARTLNRLVSDMVQSGQIDEAKQQVALAQSFLDPDEMTSLTIALYRDHGNHLLGQKDWEGALQIFKTGLDIVPGANDLKRNVSYALQEWAREALAGGDNARFVEAVNRMHDVFPNEPSLPDVLEYLLSTRAVEDVKNDKAEDALLDIDAVAEVLDDDTLHSIKTHLYDQWARRYFETDWASAAEVYTLGLADIGESSLLSNNLKYAKSKLN